MLEVETGLRWGDRSYEDVLTALEVIKERNESISRHK